MNKDEIILMLQRLVDSLQGQLDEAMRQLGEANSKVDTLLRKIEELEGLLVQKRAEEQKQRNITKGLSKLLQNKSEKQTPAKPSPVTVTVLFVRAVPSYSLVSVADVIVTLLVVTVSVP